MRRVITKFVMTSANPALTPIEAGVKLSRKDEAASNDEKNEIKSIPYQELVGSLVYLANTTRPDLAFVTNALSRFNENPGRS